MSETKIIRKTHRPAMEDFTVGRVFDHHWGRTINSSDNSIFSSITLSYNPLYLNAEYARAHGYRDIVVNPNFLLCLVIGLSVEDLSEGGGGFLGIDDLTFRAPVYAGDTITARSTVIKVRESESRPGSGIVTWRTEGYRGDELVIDFLRTNFAKKGTQDAAHG